MRVFLLSLFIATVLTQSTGPKCVCKDGVSYEGHDLNVLPVGDESQCCGLCTTTPGCKMGTIIQPKPNGPKYCHLTGSKAVQKDKAGARSCFWDRTGGASPKPKPTPRPSPPPLPKPHPAGKLPSKAEPLSTRNPVSEGYKAVKQSGDAKPKTELLCFTDGRQPKSTNHWWVPATLGPNARGKNFVTQLPYIITIEKQWMEVGYPWLMSPGANIVQNIIDRHWTMSPGGASSYCVKAADEITFTVNWSNKMEATIVRGSPFMTVRYKNAPTPIIGTQQGVRTLYIDDDEVPTSALGVAFTPKKKIVVTLRDSDETWAVYIPPNTQVKVKGGPSNFEVALPGGFTGVARIAMINNCTTGMDGVSHHCSAVNTANVENDPWIQDYADAVDEGSNVCISEAVVTNVKNKDGLLVSYNYKTDKCFDSLPLGLLTMIALPHHQAITPCEGDNRIIRAGGHRNLRGLSFAYQFVGNVWNLQYPEYEIPFIGEPDKERIPEIRKALKGRGELSDMYFDIRYDMKDGMIDPYNAGKLLAKIGRLILIADQLDEPEIQANLTSKLKTYISRWLDHETKNLLIYDQAWGGVISCGCRYIWIERKDWPEPHGYPICANNGSKLECPTLMDPNFDFGNAYYNDHHFHYGYFIYSAAVLAKFDPQWGKQYNEKVLALIRDIANPSPDDPYFTSYRYFDMFNGHSWALGIYSDPNGKGQESTSEAVNAWYGIYLYGEATNQPAVQLVGETLMAMEIHSTNFYWHVPENMDIYPSNFKHTIVGIVHDMIVEFQTYFGAAGFFVHGIQLLPITPVVHLMFHPYWVQWGFPRFQKYCDGDPFCTESGFVTFMIAEQAMIDKQGAWDAAMKLPDKVFSLETAGGNGNSLTNTLYFIAAWGNNKRKVWKSDEPVCKDWEFSKDTTDRAVDPTEHLGGDHPATGPKTMPVVGGPWWLSLLMFLAVCALLVVGYIYRQPIKENVEPHFDSFAEGTKNRVEFLINKFRGATTEEMEGLIGDTQS